ncbi:hypothetical protein OsI_20215 [Oryza sativa Indica Group]|uniref:Uncharacterized protein n=1 Tax=Oryza sativa subsp. indica TaxID=39946 RepID=A2Y5E7_ORYSI|nr:hypothetical protein OsI_20215 [Oryza sativa Indica Group]
MASQSMGGSRLRSNNCVANDHLQLYGRSNTYEDDLAYVRYRARLANETKWIEDYLARDITQAEWRRVKDIASVQALKIARVSGGVKAQAALAGFRDHIWSIQFDFNHYKDFDGVYFEIWKRVAKRKMNFREALLEVYREDMFPVRKISIKYELDNMFPSQEEVTDINEYRFDYQKRGGEDTDCRSFGAMLIQAA